MPTGDGSFAKPCPHCGHCPTCGQNTFQPIGIIPYPYQTTPLYPQGPTWFSWPPQWINPQPATWTITYGNTTTPTSTK